MTAVLSYAFDDAVFFDETFAYKRVPVSAFHRKEAVETMLRLLHFAAGVSYYKACLPEKIVLEKTQMSRAESLFFKDFYEKGLGEFSFKNNVPVHVEFPFSPNRRTVVGNPCDLSKKTVVPVGGGKDSIVTIETLKSAGFAPTCISVNRPRAICETIEASGQPYIEIERKVSPELIKLNEDAQNNGVLNGHVPVTGILAFAMALGAVLYDYSDICMSCERSANVGNTQFDGRTVNHQWSKSLEFEELFSLLMKAYLPDLRYFSLLRPLSELAIAKNFAATTKYDAVFTSCNKAFKLDEAKRIVHWCGNCDKCRFVFLALAPFMEKERLLNIFKCNPLNDPLQLSGFRRLTGMEAFKPFECVGEIEESVCAFDMIKNKPEWKDDVVVKVLSNALMPPYDKDKIFMLSDKHAVPQEYQNAFEFFKE